MKKRVLWTSVDLLIAAVILCTIWILFYKLPQTGIHAVTAMELPVSSSINANGINSSPEAGSVAVSQSVAKLETAIRKQVAASNGGLQMTDVLQDPVDWHEKFADQFTSAVVETDHSYTSPDLAVYVTNHVYDSKLLDQTANGDHKKYGSNISYTLADIYISDITQLQSVFAQDTYGVGFTEKLSDMSARKQSILAVNGDSYSNNRHKDNGTIIRNGIVYRNQPSDAELCVLNWDGTMEIYPPGTTSLRQLQKRGAYQSWIFGPSLLDQNGTAKTEFVTWDYIRESHPRTAIGYYEPGHYCLLLVDGRQKDSRGMFLDEMAKVFEDLGCQAAYNLDGGHSSFMTMKDQVINHPYKAEQKVSDGIFILP